MRPLKFIYSEKATNFCEISVVALFYIVKVDGGDFTKFCDLRIYELYMSIFQFNQLMKIIIKVHIF